ncbi:MAG TPA: 30S ribosomal protein S9 [Oligoflexia bacterium]|nr:30S ribosomal protein S9 [Oligoflexia bacterium]
MAKAIYATGRRKDASARVYLMPVEGEEEGTIIINRRALDDYFPQKTKQMIIRQPLETADRLGRYSFKVLVSGGGFSGQAQAVVHGISRALEKAEPELRPVLKKGGFLTRDPRVVERKKAGRHKARKKPQFSKR